MRPASRAAALCAACTMLFAMAGCASGPSVEERIGDRVRELSDVVDDVRVSLQKDIFTQHVVLELEVSAQSDENLASAVEAAYEGSWEAADFEPTGVAVRVTDRPLTVERSDQLAADYLELGELNDLGLRGCNDKQCFVRGTYLEDRFGPWGEQ